MWIIPSWAIGVGFVIVVIGTAQIVVRRLIGRVGGSQPDLSGLTRVLDDVQRRLGELEERMDFAERLLAKDRDSGRLAPPRGQGITPGQP